MLTMRFQSVVGTVARHLDSSVAADVSVISWCLCIGIIMVPYQQTSGMLPLCRCVQSWPVEQVPEMVSPSLDMLLSFQYDAVLYFYDVTPVIISGLFVGFTKQCYNTLMFGEHTSKMP